MNKPPLSQSDLDMHSYIDSKQTNQQGFNSLPRFLPLGMMFTEEMYKANFILDKWLKRRTSDEQSAAAEAGKQE